MRFKLAYQVTAVCLLAIATAAIAQQPGQGQGGRGGRGGGGPGMGGGGGFITRMFLLFSPEVRKELDLADEQVTELEKVAAELREKYPMGGGRGGGGPPGGGQRGNRGQGNNNNEGALIVPTQWYFVQAQQPGQQGQGRGRFQPPTPEERAAQEQMRIERGREERAKLSEILLPNQLKRLNEIYLQQVGVSALQDEDIAKDLGISDAQKAQLTKIRDDFSAKRREMFQPGGGGGGGGGDFETIRAKIMELTKQQDEQSLAVLSGQQKAKFEEMKGKPFAMPEGGFGRGGGPGGPGGNRGRGGNRGNNN